MFTSSPSHSKLMLSSLFVLVVALISNYLCNGWRKPTSFINLDVYAFKWGQFVLCVSVRWLWFAGNLLERRIAFGIVASLGIFWPWYTMWVYFSYKFVHILFIQKYFPRPFQSHDLVTVHRRKFVNICKEITPSMCTSADVCPSSFCDVSAFFA